MSVKLVEVRREAEKAVADMQEGPLKTRAFEVILGHLLAGDGVPQKQMGKAAKAPRLTARKLARQQQPVARSTTGPMGRVSALVAEDFFKKSKLISDVQAALKEQGYNYPITTLSSVLVRLTRKRLLRRTREKLNEKKLSYVYSNW